MAWNFSALAASVTGTDWVLRHPLPLHTLAATDSPLAMVHARWSDLRRGARLPAPEQVEAALRGQPVRGVFLADAGGPRAEDWMLRPLGFGAPGSWSWARRRTGLGACPWPRLRCVLAEDFGTVRLTGSPAYHEVWTRLDGREEGHARLILPLASDGRRVDGLLVGLRVRPVTALDPNLEPADVR